MKNKVYVYYVVYRNSEITGVCEERISDKIRCWKDIEQIMEDIKKRNDFDKIIITNWKLLRIEDAAENNANENN